jgi:DNA recombination protein RmuC
MVGALESRVLVTARRMHDLDLVGDPLPVLTPVEIAPRPLTAQELIDAVTEDDRRPELPSIEPPGVAVTRDAG